MRNYDFEGDDKFVSPADIDDGYEPGMSDAERGERQMRETQRALSQKFDFSKPVDENYKANEKSKKVSSELADDIKKDSRQAGSYAVRDYSQISVEDAKTMSDTELSDSALAYQERDLDDEPTTSPTGGSGDGFKPLDGPSPFEENVVERPSHIHKGLSYKDPVPGMSEREISDMALEAQEEAEDRAYERYMTNKDIAKAMNDGQSAASKEIQAENDGKDIPN